MKTLRAILALAGTIALLASCSEEKFELTQDPGVGVYTNVASASAAPGHIRVKFSSEPAATKAGNGPDLSSLGSCRMVRTVPEDSRFEERHRKAGLHLWYDIFFDESLPLTKAAGEVSSLEGVDIVEFVEPVRLQSVFSFNDPYFSNQWHYYNPGTKAGSVKGSDINLLPAWEKTTGRPDVIVAISDAGLDVDHEDLAANMWVNEAELNGQPGVDDDGNGYIDDVYGYNFVVGSDGETMKGTIEPGDHGVHVGGTVAAVNNNGVGVCGIAGGDGSKGSGVRLMSTQTSGGSAYIGDAFVYAADNGAVLVNCSWSIDSYSAYISENINYFNTYAGMDKDGRQTGPMAGGLVIFAAGNESTNTSYPAQQDNVFAVASIGADYQAAYYTNYGDWVDITAPGGDANKGFQVLSTLPDNNYGSMQGTSMACPHAVGVAALVVSQFGGPGFTRQNLIDILQGTANSIIYEKNAAKFKGQLGAGLIDAGAAVNLGVEAPSAVTDMTCDAKGNILNLSWTAASEGTTPYSYDIYYKDEPFSSLSPASDAEYVSVLRGDVKPGAAVTYAVEGLEFNTKYYFLIASVSPLGTKSGYTAYEFETKANSKPVVTPLGGTSITLKSHETGKLKFTATDADGHALSCRLSDSLKGASVELTGSNLIVTIEALTVEDGKTYDGYLYVSDGYETVETAISYTIEKNNAPVATGELENTVFGALKQTSNIHLNDCFSDIDGETLSYECKILSGGNSTITSSFSGSELKIVAASYGTATIKVTATDARGAKAEATFSVLVRDGSRPVDLYPNPVKDKLYVRPGSTQTADVTVSNKAGAVVLSAEGSTLDPFAPLTFDMKSLPGGVYYVTISGESGSETYSVVKQ